MSAMPLVLEFRKKYVLVAGLYKPIVSDPGPGPPPPAVMEKFEFDTSKKTLPAPSTFTRALVVAMFGTTTLWLPSFGVLAARTVGKVFPPSVESDILTLAQLTGAPAVLATFHVTVCVEPPPQFTAVFGDVTTKGPALDVTASTIASELTPPPAARLSRTVALKFIFRVVVGSASPIVDVLFRMSDSFGNVREGLAAAGNERKTGRAPSSVIGGEAAPRSISSHEYVSGSLSGSLAVAVNVKGVPIGIVKSAPALTVGELFPVTVEVGQAAVLTLKFTI